MKQMSLFPRKSSSSTRPVSVRLERYFRENLEAAHIIAEQPERYAGVLQEWARLFIGRATRIFRRAPAGTAGGADEDLSERDTQ